MENLKITSKEKLIYISNLINQIYKLLPLTENNDYIVPKTYVGRLLMNIDSANNLFNGELIHLIVKLNCIYENDLEHQELRTIVFESISLCNKIIDKL